MIFLVAQPANASFVVALTWGGGAHGGHISDSPVAVHGITYPIEHIQAANWGGLAIDSTGKVYSWASIPDPEAALVSGPRSVVSIGEGGGKPFGAAVTRTGTVWTWGWDQFGQLCNRERARGFLAPAPVRGLEHAVKVSGGAQHLLVLDSSGRVEACGDDAQGELGDGRFKSHSDVPVHVVGLHHVVAISAGREYSMALDSAGNVWAWGLNNWGQLGDGNTRNTNAPVEVPLPSPAVEICAGGSLRTNGQSVALLANGQVWAWGNDSWGQLGNGVAGNFSDVPILASALPTDVTWTYVATGGQTSYAIDSTGQLWAWGDDSRGQIGNGSQSGYVLQPTVVESDVDEVSAVAYVAVALVS